ncbi:unnamed protein product [Larinioides sclopetarius]|uniref:Uncharacterized protein n=1 Tax=Larinioides sclopetarius TaxID=280406 RepID=A0AAV2A2H6_9ARAC
MRLNRIEAVLDGPGTAPQLLGVGNYDNGPKVSVFSLPKNEELKKKWPNATPRENMPSTKNFKEVLTPTPPIFKKAFQRGNYDNGPKVSVFSLPKNEELKKMAGCYSPREHAFYEEFQVHYCNCVIMSQIVGVWDITLNGKKHLIEFEHGTTSGRRIVRVDGKVI